VGIRNKSKFARFVAQSIGSIIPLFIMLSIASMSASYNLQAQELDGPVISTGDSNVPGGDAASVTAAAATNTWTSDFIDKVKTDLSREIDNQGLGLSASIFETLTNQTLFSHDFGLLSLGLQVKREIYNNHDILDSFTVVDYMRLPITIPIAVSGDVPVGPVMIGAGLKLSIGMNAINIRQVSNGKQLPPIPFKVLKENATNEELITNLTPSEESTSLFQKIKKWITGDSERPESRARWSKILNLFIHPFRMPITKKGIHRLQVGEIFSYGIDGAVELDAHVGWNLVSIPGFENTLKAAAGITTFVQGRFRISLIKESANKVHVKLNRVHNYGTSLYLGSAHTLVPFQGFVVFGTNIGKISESIVPFNLSRTISEIRSFDVGYTYDIDTEEGMQAYQAALMGRFKLSAKYADEKKGVEWKYNRREKTTSQTAQYRMGLSILFERTKGKNKRNSAIVIKDAEGTHHIFKGNSSSRVGYDTLWGQKESHSFDFSIAIDRETYYRTDTRGMVLRVAGQMEDTHTTFSEINRYIKEVDEATGMGDLFPSVPRYFPNPKCTADGLNIKKNKVTRECKKPGKKSKFGASSFYYRLGYNRQAMTDFINYPINKMWQTLAIAFGEKPSTWKDGSKRLLYELANIPLHILNLPLALAGVKIKRAEKLIAARRFRKIWRRIRNARSLDEISASFSSLFFTADFSLDFINILNRSLPDHANEYYIMAKNPTFFGTITKTGNTIPDSDNPHLDRNRQIDFESPGNRVKFDLDAKITGLMLQQVDGNNVKVVVTFPNRPDFVYLGVDRSSAWRKYKNLASLVIFNRQRFNMGENTLLIPRDYQGEDKIIKILSEVIFDNSYVTIKMAQKIGDKGWGPVSSAREKIEKPGPGSN